ncbi:MAG: phosphoribosylanthranilate isomerase [Gammaproteobacteria bacterium]|nr:phosphoribosylanthranilate isomerase [Gammaproteobacteria bacterium]
MTTRVKICGITRLEDARVAAQAGADALGFVFYGPSPRNVEPEQAGEMVRQLPAFVTSTGLFVDAERAFVEQVLAQVPLDLLQFHGDETPDYCESFGRPYIKALRMQPGVDIAALAQSYQEARGILLDAWVPGVPGGTGTTFDWNSIPQALAKPLILAGGLDVDNVQLAIRQVRPWAVDISGGVEAAKGIKDAGKVRAFMQQVRSLAG